MNLALHWCAKEWRAQRAFVLAYVPLVVVAVAAATTIAFWRNFSFESEERRAGVVVWFAGLTALGAFFAAGYAVRGELVGNADQLWRRLPGALAPAFVGKLLFLALLLPLMALAGAVVGEVYLWAMDLGPAAPSVVASEAALLRPAVDLGVALLPWVFALACWLPGGRFALGATAVLAGGIAVAVTASLRSSPGLELTLRAPWLVPCVLGLGFSVAWISCVWGRRGGDHRRSMWLGVVAAVLGLLPPGAWFGSWLHAYWCPDLSHPSYVTPRGVTADGRYALVEASVYGSWPEVAVRIDLQNGEAVRLGRPYDRLTAWWRDSSWFAVTALAHGGVCCIEGRGGMRLVDLHTLASHTFAWEERGGWALAPHLRRYADLGRTGWPLRQPSDLPAWVEGDDLCLANADGSVTRERLPGTGFHLFPLGHAFGRSTHDERIRHYDLTLRRHVVVPAGDIGHVAVRGIWLLRPKALRREQGEHTTWQRFDPQTSETTAIAGLPAGGSDFLGLLDDDRALFCVLDGAHGRIVAYDPARDALTEVGVPDHPLLAGRRIHATGSGPTPYGERDPRGRMIVYLHPLGRLGNLIVAVEPTTLSCDVLLATDLLTQIMAFEPSGDILCCEDWRRVVRYCADGRRRTVVYPVPSDRAAR